MACKYFCVRSRKNKKYRYCRFYKKEITADDCYQCPDRIYKKIVHINKISKKKIVVTPDTYLDVTMRDNFTCQLCGTKSNIQLHHIIYRSEDRNKINDVDNLICLCVKCHRLVHTNKKYWQPILINLIKKENNGKGQ